MSRLPQRGARSADDGSGGDTLTLEGTVKQVRFRNPDSFWTIATLQTRGRFEPITIVGAMPGLGEGMTVKVAGRYETNARFGQQFRVESHNEVMPVTTEALEAYLSSGFIPGVGPKLAARIVQTLGPKTLELIAREPARLSDVPGLGRKRADAVVTALHERRGAQDALVFLLGLGISRGLAIRIYKRYGDDAASLVRDNPYRLVQDVHGVGFIKADQVARGMKIAEDHPERLRAGLIHVLREARGEGHVRLPERALLDKADALLRCDRGLLEEALSALVAQGTLVSQADHRHGDPCLYLASLYDAECGAAHHLSRLLAAAPPALVSDPDRAASDAAERLAVTLAPNQLRAVAAALREPVAVVTGGPGTGKTTIIRTLLEATPLKPERIALCAPTGRAAKRMSEATGRAALTIHRLLEFNPAEHGFQRDEEDPLDADVVIVDEASMVDLPLFYALLRAIADGARLILVGDRDQLPPVGPGAPLTDLIAAERVPVARLTDIFRQGAGSAIVEAAHAINHGVPVRPSAPTPDSLSDFYFVLREDAEGAAALMDKLIATRIPERFGFDPIRDVQVLTPMRSGPLGVDALNKRLQALLNPAPDEAEAPFNLSARGAPRAPFRPGDKVMQIRNDYERGVFNGDIGLVRDVQEHKGTLTVVIDDRPVSYDRESIDDLVLAYAITIHKSQGSEYPVVVAPVSHHHYIMLKRNLLYTAVTRGKRLVILIGTEEAMRTAVSNATVERRESGFTERLRGLIDGSTPLLDWSPRAPEHDG